MAGESCPTARRAMATTSAVRANSRSSPTSTRPSSIPRPSTPRSFVDFTGDVCIIPPNSFALARTVEYFRIPRNVLTICLGKSTYARCGIIVNVTPFEPEWEGYVTLEFSNTTPLPAKIYANEGCAQVHLLRVRRGLRDLLQGPGRQVPGPERRDTAQDLSPAGRHRRAAPCPVALARTFTRSDAPQPPPRVAQFRPEGVAGRPDAPFPFSQRNCRRSMRMKFHFPIVIIDEDFRSENTSGLGIRALAEAIEKEGHGGARRDQLRRPVRSSPSSRAAPRPSSCRSMTRNSGAGARDRTGDRRTCAPSSRRSASRMPRSRSTCTARRARRRHIPNDILRELHGFIHMYRGHAGVRRPPHHPRGQVLPRLAGAAVLPRAGRLRAGRLLLLALPGAFGRRRLPQESPVGQMFHQFFGENMLRADVCNAVDELGQLLDHTGPVAASERNAARIFNADHCFFVTNGTSTSNKIVWHVTVAPGDIVVVDRNCHKSILHAITMTGAIPVFLTPTRNHLRHHRPDPARGIQAGEHRQPKIEANPFAREAKNKKPRILTHHAEHLRRHRLQRRDAQGHARRQHRDAAFRRGLAAARGLPRLLPRHARHRRAIGRAARSR